MYYNIYTMMIAGGNEYNILHYIYDDEKTNE